MGQLNLADWDTRRAPAPDDMTLGTSGDRGDRLRVLAGFTVTETPAQQ